MSEPELKLYCGACGARLVIERIPTSAGGVTHWLNGRAYCPAPGCPNDQGAVDRDGNTVTY